MFVTDPDRKLTCNYRAVEIPEKRHGGVTLAGAVFPNDP
jgi:hypothetical protein